ncbi:MAG: hypothetical protein ACYDAC_10370 [Candidatus Dormibacteria bacterium]
MGFCRCDPPPTLHLTPSGLHAPEGGGSPLRVAEEVRAGGDPSCSTCGTPIDATAYRCEPCDALICRECVARETAIVECDCGVAMGGVQMAARRAASLMAG